MATASRRIDSQAQTVGEILRKPVSYHVPVYQRDFAWSQEQLDSFWEDIKGAIEHDSPEYFLGAVVLSPRNGQRGLDIVDGQQRLAVLSILWGERRDEKRAIGVFRDFLGSEDRRTGDVQPKLSLNETNDPIYQAVVLRGAVYPSSERRAWPLSNQLFYAAIERLSAHLSAWLDSFEDKEAAIFDFEEFLDSRVNLIVIQVDDESDAFTLFETLNDRGLELAVSDLVKNYLFSLGREHLDRFKQVWSEVSLVLAGEGLTQFLRHLWLSEFGPVRERELYRELRKSITGATKARQFMERYGAYTPCCRPLRSSHKRGARLLG